MLRCSAAADRQCDSLHQPSCQQPPALLLTATCAPHAQVMPEFSRDLILSTPSVLMSRKGGCWGPSSFILCERAGHLHVDGSLMSPVLAAACRQPAAAAPPLPTSPAPAAHLPGTRCCCPALQATCASTSTSASSSLTWRSSPAWSRWGSWAAAARRRCHPAPLPHTLATVLHAGLLLAPTGGSFYPGFQAGPPCTSLDAPAPQVHGPMAGNKHLVEITGTVWVSGRIA